MCSVHEETLAEEQNVPRHIQNSCIYREPYSAQLVNSPTASTALFKKVRVETVIHQMIWYESVTHILERRTHPFQRSDYEHPLLCKRCAQPLCCTQPESVAGIVARKTLF